MWAQLPLRFQLLAPAAPAAADRTPRIGAEAKRFQDEQLRVGVAAERAAPAFERSTSSTADKGAAAASTTRRRRSKLAVPTARTPSLRVIDLGVAADGALLRLDTPKVPLGDFVVAPNSVETPYEFENAFVRGKLLFLLNQQDAEGAAAAAAPPAQRVEQLFRGKRRLFWVQMQLQFKQAPTGVVYIGGEVPRAMALGFFTGGLAKIILSVLQSLVRGLHCSFGAFRTAAAATDDNDDDELPHICFPLYTAVDQFVCTPAGAAPPALGSPDFGEPKEAALARRRSGAAHYAYSTTATYSFHFHSYFIDFARWKLQSVPGMRDMDLSAFWADMPLQLVAYNLKAAPASLGAASDGDAKKAAHTRRAKEYKFCFELSHRVQEPLLHAAAADDDLSRLSVDDADLAGSDDAAQLDELQRELSRFAFHVPSWFEYFSTSPMHSERRVGYALLVREYDDAAAVDGSSSSLPPRRRAVKREYMVLHTALFAYAPLSFIEHELGASTPRRRGSVFASAARKSLEESISVRARSNKYSKIEDERAFLEFQLAQLARQDATRARVRPDQLFAAQSALLDLLQHKRTALHAEWPFLSRASCRANNSGSSSSALSAAHVVASGSQSPSEAIRKDAPHAAVQVVRVVTARRWRHEWLTLDRANRVLRFFRMMASVHSFSVPLDQVLVVSVDDDHESFGRSDGSGSTENPSGDSGDDVEPAAGELFWMHVALLEKCHHVAFGSESERERWIASITDTIEATAATDGGADSDSVLAARLQQPIVQSTERLTLDAFASSSDGSPKPRGRFVLNDRCDFVAHATKPRRPSDTDKDDNDDDNDPNRLVAQSLRRVIALQSRSLQAGSTRELVAFLLAVSALKWLDLSALRDDDAARKAFFLNLFHLAQLHASVLGFLPKSKLHWGKFFNGVSYNVGGLRFSLAEIEHCVVRAPMAPLRLPIAFLVIPRFQHPEHDARAAFALTTPDFRLNFALNCMTKSCWDAVPVYDRAHLDAQLDLVVRETLDLSLTYDRESRVVYLPKACDWYRGDFTAAAAASESSSSSGTSSSAADAELASVNLSMLRLLVPFVHRRGKRELLEYVLRRQDALIAKFKFSKYDFRFQEAPLKEATRWHR